MRSKNESRGAWMTGLGVLIASLLTVASPDLALGGQTCSNQAQIDACIVQSCGRCGLSGFGACWQTEDQCNSTCFTAFSVCYATTCNADPSADCISGCLATRGMCEGLCGQQCATCIEACGAPCENLCVVCDAGGPYSIECDTEGTPTIQLDGSGSLDPAEGTYFWTTDCPGASINPNNTVNPILTLGTPLVCLECSVTLRIEEEDGGSASCTAAVSVTDDERPTVGTPAELTECYTSSSAAREAACAALLAVAEDNCDTDLFCNTFTIGEPSECADVIYAFVEDDCDNSLEFSVPFEARIDEGAPTATCSAFQTEYEVDENCEAIIKFKGQITDNCCVGVSRSFPSEVKIIDGDGIVGSAGIIGCVANRSDDEKTVDVECTFKVSHVTTCPVVVEWSFDASDCCGNTLAERCVATTNVVDKIAPTITCPEAITLERGDKICDSAVEEWLNSATATDNCVGGEVYEVADLNKAIPDADIDGVESTIIVLDSFIVEDVNVDLTITHPWVGDLMVILYHEGLPAGRTLISRPNPDEVAFGCDADNYQGIILDDEAASSIQDQCMNNLTSPPNYIPIGSLDFFDGVNAQGNWTLRVIDAASTQVGTLEGWSLHFSFAGTVPITTDAPECGFPPGSTTTVTFTATDGCGNTSSCKSDITIEPLRRAAADQKGSLLAFSKIEIKWDADGNLIQDTLLDVANDAVGEGVEVQAYFINGDIQLSELTDMQGNIIQEFEPGWNTADCRFHLTKNQPHFWSAAKGSTKCQPFTVLDEDGRLDSEAADGTRLLRGFVIMWAVKFIDQQHNGTVQGLGEDGYWEEIRWNHLKGDAVIVNYQLGSAWEYNAWAYQARCGATGEPLLDCQLVDANGTCCQAEIVPGRLDLDGFQYDINFDELLLDFYASGSTGLSNTNVGVMVDTDLTIHSMDVDVRQDGNGPILTKAEFEIFNENESKFSGTRRCICCWDQTLLSNYVRTVAVPNHFLRSKLGTNKGYARINGVHSDECDYFDTCGLSPRPMGGLVAGVGGPNFSRDTALVGLAFKILTFTGTGTNIEWAGGNLHGTGEQASRIFVDVEQGSGEAHAPATSVSTGAPVRSLPTKAVRGSTR